MSVYLDREDLEQWGMEELRNLKREVYWALSAKESKEKVVLWQIEEYAGVSKAFLNFENALKYVKENIEASYREGFKCYTDEGYPSYITLAGYAPKIVPKLYLPDDLEAVDVWFVLDKESIIE